MCVRLTTGTQLLQLHACPLQYSFNQEQQCIVIHSGSCLGRCMEAEEAARSSATTNKSHSKTIPKAHNALEAQRIAACNDNPTNQHATAAALPQQPATVQDGDACSRLLPFKVVILVWRSEKQNVYCDKREVICDV